MSVTIAAAPKQSLGVALATAIGANSTIELRSGGKPATADTAATGTLLATVNVVGSFTSTAGVLTATDPVSVLPVAAGTAGYFRVLTSGAAPILDGTATASGGGGDLQLGSLTITMGVSVDLGVPTITVPSF